MTVKAIVHQHLPDGAKTTLLKEGFEVIEIPPSWLVDKRIAGHPDLQLFIFNTSIFTHPNLPHEFASLLPADRLIFCKKKLGEKYPMDCTYNIACTGRFALYKNGIIPDEIEKALASSDIIHVNIPQGYARCSTVIIDENSIITEDAGIHSKALEYKIDSLLIPHGLIPLKGFNRGFIGGASGTFADTVYFTGKFSQNSTFGEISAFILKKGKKILELCDQPAEDFGSIIFI